METSFFVTLFLLVLRCAHSHLLSGYICPTCASDPDPNSLDKTIHKGYNRVIFAFLVWRADGTIVNKYDAPYSPKYFTLKKEDIEAIKSQNNASVFISVGGDTADPLQCDESSNTKFIDNFVNGVLDVTNKLGFDGVDFDIEHRSGDFVECAELVAKIIDRLYANNLMISMAPQMTNVYPDLSTVSSGWNELAPLVSMLNNSVLEYVQVQMYNMWSEYETVEYAKEYVKKLIKGYTVSSNGKQYFVQVPASHLVLGYPASSTEKPTVSGYIDPDKLTGMWKDLKDEGIEIAGFMTWTIGWDQLNNWKFVENVAMV